MPRKSTVERIRRNQAAAAEGTFPQAYRGYLISRQRCWEPKREWLYVVTKSHGQGETRICSRYSLEEAKADIDLVADPQ